MFLLKQILPAVIIAVMVAAGWCGIAVLWKKESTRVLLESLGVGTGYFLGHLFVTGWVVFPPKDTTNWLPFFAVATAIVSALCRVLALRTSLRLLFLFLTSAFALRLLLKPRFEYGWSPSEGYLWISLLAATVVLIAFILEAVASISVRPIELPLLLLILSAGCFAVLILSGSMLLSQFAAILGGAVFGILALIAGKINPGLGAIPVFALLLITLLVSGCSFAELPASCAILIALAPAMALLPVARLSLPTVPVRALLVSVPILVALFLAFHSSPPLSY